MTRFFDDIRLPRDPDNPSIPVIDQPDIAATKRYVDRTIEDEIEKGKDHTHPPPSTIRAPLIFNNIDMVADPFPITEIWLGRSYATVPDLYDALTITLSTTVPDIFTGDNVDISGIATQMGVGDKVSVTYYDDWTGSATEFCYAEYEIQQAVVVDETNGKIEISVGIPPPLYPPIVTGSVVFPHRATVEFRWLPKTATSHTHPHDQLDGLNDEDKHDIDDVTGLDEALDEKSDVGHVHPPLPTSGDVYFPHYDDVYTNYIAPIPGSGGISFVGATESPSTTTDDRAPYAPVPLGVLQGDFIGVYLTVYGCPQPIVLTDNQIWYDESSGWNPLNDPVDPGVLEQWVSTPTDVDYGLTGATDIQQQFFYGIADQQGTGFVPPYADIILTLPDYVPTGLPMKMIVLAYRGIDPSNPVHSVHNAFETSSVTIPAMPADQKHLVVLASLASYTDAADDTRAKYFYTNPWSATRSINVVKVGAGINHFYGEFYYPSDSSEPFPTVYLLAYPSDIAPSTVRAEANGITILRSKLGASDGNGTILIDGDVIIDGSLDMLGPIDMNDNPITGLPSPQPDDPSSAVSKAYVDSTIWKPKSVRVRSDSNTPIWATGVGDDIDNVTLEIGDRVLLTDQFDQRDNGVWIVEDDHLVRSPDFAEYYQMMVGSTVYVKDGDLYATMIFTQVTIDDERKDFEWDVTDYPTFQWEQGAHLMEVLWGNSVPEPKIRPGSFHTVVWIDPDYRL